MRELPVEVLEPPGGHGEAGSEAGRRVARRDDADAELVNLEFEQEPDDDQAPQPPSNEQPAEAPETELSIS